MDEKVYPWGLPPIVSFRLRRLHVIPLYQSGSREDSLKHGVLLVFHSFLTDQPSHSRWLRRWKLSFSRLCNSVVLFGLLKAMWHLPMRKPSLSTLFRRSRTDEVTRLSRTLPWDDSIARTLDREVHRRKMAGKSYRFCSESIHSFPHTLFSRFAVVFPDLEFRRQVLWPTHLSLCPRRCRLNWAARFWVPICSS